MDMGAVQNRRFGRLPLVRLIELIRYKAQALGLVVVTTEESYTSKISFVNNEALKVHEKEKRKTQPKQQQASAAAAAPDSEPVAQAIDAPALGKRLKQDRHTFVNHTQTGRWAKVHADVNAAFNMLRKLFSHFAFHDGLTLKYHLMRLSPRYGLTSVRI